MASFVKESEVEYREIIRRGGANGGDEDFAFLQCPACGFIFLADYEVDTVYLAANDLSSRIAFTAPGDVIDCPQCETTLLAEEIWAALQGEPYMEKWRVTWEKFQAGAWSWAAKRAE